MCRISSRPGCAFVLLWIADVPAHGQGGRRAPGGESGTRCNDDDPVCGHCSSRHCARTLLNLTSHDAIYRKIRGRCGMIQEVFIVPQRPIQDDTVTEGGCDTKNLMGVPTVVYSYLAYSSVGYPLLADRHRADTGKFRGTIATPPETWLDIPCLYSALRGRYRPQLSLREGSKNSRSGRASRRGCPPPG